MSTDQLTYVIRSKWRRRACGRHPYCAVPDGGHGQLIAALAPGEWRRCYVGRVARSKREQMLRSAWTVIARRGVNGLRVEDVAEAVGATNSLVYYHFDNRAGLLAATVEYNEAAAAGATLPDPRRPQTGFESVESMLLSDLAAGKRARENSIVWNELTAAAVFDDNLADRVAASARRWTSEVASQIARGVTDGSVKKNVDVGTAASLLTALQGGLISKWLIGGETREHCCAVLRSAVHDLLA